MIVIGESFEVLRVCQIVRNRPAWGSVCQPWPANAIGFLSSVVELSWL